MNSWSSVKIFSLILLIVFVTSSVGTAIINTDLKKHIVAPTTERIMKYKSLSPAGNNKLGDKSSPLNYSQYYSYNLVRITGHRYDLYLSAVDCQLFYASGALKSDHTEYIYQYLTNLWKQKTPFCNDLNSNKDGDYSDADWFASFFLAGALYPHVYNKYGYGAFNYSKFTMAIKNGVLERGALLVLEQIGEYTGMRIMTQENIPWVDNSIICVMISTTALDTDTFDLYIGLNDLQFWIGTFWHWWQGSDSHTHSAGDYIDYRALAYYFRISVIYGNITKFTDSSGDKVSPNLFDAYFDKVLKEKEESSFFTYINQKIASNSGWKVAFLKHYGFHIHFVGKHYHLHREDFWHYSLSLGYYEL